jgi:hypothetical protein
MTATARQLVSAPTDPLTGVLLAVAMRAAA